MARIVSSINCAWLKEGVTMLMRGHGWLPGIRSGRRALSSVHGQPLLSGGGGGSSFKEGQCMGSVFDSVAEPTPPVLRFQPESFPEGRFENEQAIRFLPGLHTVHSSVESTLDRCNFGNNVGTLTV